MTASVSPAASRQAAVDAALLVLKSMGLSPEDLTATPGQRPAVPTFAEYVPVVSAQVTDGTLRAYGSYWNRVVDRWGSRRLDEPTPSEVKQFAKDVKENAVSRLGEHLPWVKTQQVSAHWIRHTILTRVERRFGFAVAQAYAGHQTASQGARAMGATGTYVRAGLPEVATALSVLTSEQHPLASEGPRTDINRSLDDP